MPQEEQLIMPGDSAAVLCAAKKIEENDKLLDIDNDDLSAAKNRFSDQRVTDRFNLVYLTFVLHGIGTLMPWNMFITAKMYFVDYKLSTDYTGVESTYSTNFLAYIGFASQIPNLIFSWLNIFMQIGGSLTTRIVWSLFIEVVIFTVTVILAMVDSSGWPGVFFWVTMVSVVVLNMMGGIYQNTVYGMAAKLPPKYTGAVVLGSNISGTFATLISIGSMYLAPSPNTAATYYFITALFVLLACFDSYFALPLNHFYRYHDKLNKKKDTERSEPTPYLQILKKCLPQMINVCLLFFVTLAIFPAVHSDIKRSDPDFVINEKYFTAITCFLTFNLCAMLGNLLAGWFTWPGPRLLIIPVLLRFLLIPFFVVCNYQPANLQRQFPVLIENDWLYWLASVILGLSSGYYSSLAMMYCPQSVESKYAPTAGMFGAAALITGIFAGILFSSFFPMFVSQVSV